MRQAIQNEEIATSYKLLRLKKKMVDLTAISGCDSLFCIKHAPKSEFQADFYRVRTKVLTVFCANSLSKSTAFTLKLQGLCCSNSVITPAIRKKSEKLSAHARIIVSLFSSPSQSVKNNHRRAYRRVPGDAD